MWLRRHNMRANGTPVIMAFTMSPDGVPLNDRTVSGPSVKNVAPPIILTNMDRATRTNLSFPVESSTAIFVRWNKLVMIFSFLRLLADVVIEQLVYSCKRAYYYSNHNQGPVNPPRPGWYQISGLKDGLVPLCSYYCHCESYQSGQKDSEKDKHNRHLGNWQWQP